MIGRVFVDTNVLIYTRDVKAEEKRQTAFAWLDRLETSGRLLINLQVINELTRWLLRNDPHRPPQAIRREVDAMRAYGDAPVSAPECDVAWDVRETLGYQWFDCLLLASAANAGCSHFLSEDMGHETRYGSLTIINPFRVDPDSFLSKN